LENGKPARGIDIGYVHSPEALSTESIGLQHLAAEYLPRLFATLGTKPGSRILDIGCGVGQVVSLLRKQGYDAFGLEPGGRFAHIEHSMRGRLIFNEYSNEFQAEPFDFCLSNGVLEHVGTITGHDDLGPNYREERRAFMQSIIRLTKPGGHILIACPNRLFPFDFQHGPHGYGSLHKLKRRFAILSRLTVPWHPENYLASFNDIARLCDGADITPIRVPQRQYLALTLLANHSVLRRAFNTYISAVDMLPARAWDFLHTHTLFVARKGPKAGRIR
jgi:SAM-dependent methyltransferase